MEAVPTWTVIGARTMGTSHRKTGRPCQDAYRYLVKDGVLGACLADGAGSAEWSRKGANLAVTAAIEQFAKGLVPREQNHDLELLVRQCAQAARNSLENLAAELGEGSLPKLACTFLMTIWKPPQIASLQIGDGWIVHIYKKNAISPIEPERGEYVNQTAFITGRNWSQKMKVTCESPGDGLLGLSLISDGLERVSVDLGSGKPSTVFFQSMGSWLQGQQKSLQQKKRELLKFLDSPRICAETDDDKSVILAMVNTPQLSRQ